MCCLHLQCLNNWVQLEAEATRGMQCDSSERQKAEGQRETSLILVTSGG